jgi:hypothetical protein
MADRNALRAIARRLSQSAASGRWQDLARADRDAAELVRLHGARTLAQASAWPEFEQAHAEARLACEDALVHLGARMAELQDRRQAGFAYVQHALDGESDA